jgi:hypothetical protein
VYICETIFIIYVFTIKQTHTHTVVYKWVKGW